MRRHLQHGATGVLLLVCLLGCGHAGGAAPASESTTDADVLPLLESEGGGHPLEGGAVQSLGLTAAGDVLVPLEGVAGRASRMRWQVGTTEERRRLTAAQRRVKRTHQLALALQPGVTWAQVRTLLGTCLAYPEGCCRVHVAMQDDASATRWSRFPACRGSSAPANAPGVRITLGGGPQEPNASVQGLGDLWPLARGCDGLLQERVASWDTQAQTLWARWLDDLQGLASPEEPLRLVVRAQQGVPARAVLALIEAVEARGLGPTDLGLRSGRTFTDPVDRALRWLAAQQAPEGHWEAFPARLACGSVLPESAPVTAADPRHAEATGLALLAFLGAGYTNRGKHPYAKVVSHGLRYLKRVQHPEGRFGARDVPAAARAHAWAAWAMLEAYGMTGSPILRWSAQQGTRLLERAALPTAEDALTLLSTALALRSAREINRDAQRRGKAAPLEVDTAVLADLLAEARRVPAEGGGVAAAAALFLRLALDESERAAPEAVRGLRALADAVAAQGTETDPMLTWCAGSASIRVGGESFKRWTQVVGAPFEAAQHGGTHPCCRTGSWDAPAGMVHDGGRLAATAMMCLAFEVYYRYEAGRVGR